MEISIFNFRGIKEEVFNFKKGLNLLKGESGSGKTTILEAVKWCLFGNIKNIIPLDAPISSKVKIRVSVRIGTTLIMRTNRPEKVEYTAPSGDVFEGAEAKEKIKEKFGTHPLWETCSYLSQDEKNFLLQSSQKEKTDIIKEILFDMSHEDNNWYKNRFEDYKSSLKEKNCTKMGEIEILENDLGDVDDMTPKEIQKLLKRKEHLNDLPKLVKKNVKISKKIEEYEKFQNFLKERDQSKKNLDSYPFPLDYKIFQKWNRYWEIKNEISVLCKGEYPFAHSHSREEVLDFQRKENENNKILEYFNISNECDLQSCYEEKMKNLQNGEVYQYKLERSKKLEKIKNRICELEGKINILEKKDVDMNIFSRVSEEGKFLPEKCTIYMNRLQEINDCVHKVCPECKTNLIINENGKLVVPDENPENSKNNLREVQKIEKRFKKIDKYDQELTQLKREQESYLDVEDFKENSEGPVSPSVLQKECKILSKYSWGLPFHEFNEMIRYLDYKELTDELEKKFTSEEKELFELYPYPFDEIEGDTYLQKYLDSKNSYERSVKFLEKYEIITEEEYKKKTEKAKLIEEEVQKLEKVKEVVQGKEKIDAIKERRLEVGLNNEKMSKASLLSDKIETLINQNLEMFLVDFNNLVNESVSFVFEGMSIYLSLFKKNKTNKKTKPNVNIEINYKGNQCDSFNILSGGEKKRLSMVFTLVFCVICDCPFILLDEFMDSLNERWRIQCVKLIRHLARDRVVVNVCHEAIEGTYDNIVEAPLS